MGNFQTNGSKILELSHKKDCFTVFRPRGAYGKYSHCYGHNFTGLFDIGQLLLGKDVVMN